MSNSHVLAVIPAADYLFMCRFASELESRFYLRGVAVQRCIKPGVMLIATDGHAMGVMRLESDQGFSIAAPFIVSASKVIKTAVKRSKREQTWIVCRADGIDVVRTSSSITPIMDDIVNATPCFSIPAAVAYVDGTFPEWRNIMPRHSVNGNRDGKNSTGVEYSDGIRPDQLARFQIGENSISFDWNEGGPMLVDNGDERFIGVVMPTRNGKPSATVAANRDHVVSMPAIDTMEGAA